jgi:hypothetical protein
VRVEVSFIVGSPITCGLSFGKIYDSKVRLGPKPCQSHYYVLPVTTLLRVYLWEWLTGSILRRDKTCGIFYDFTVLQ